MDGSNHMKLKGQRLSHEPDKFSLLAGLEAAHKFRFPESDGIGKCTQNAKLPSYRRD